MGGTADRFLKRHPHLLDEDRASPRAARWLSAVSLPLQWWFRFRAEGLERIPAGRCIVVANHSAAAPQEIALLLRAWRGRFGDRPVRGLVHQIAWQWPFKALPILQAIGGILAHPAVARRALEREQALLVFPGGDVEALRPFSERYRIVHEGRTGFVRLARETGAPIVPLVLCGSHAAYVMLPGTRATGRALRLDRHFGFKGFPLTLGFVGTVAAAALTAWWPPLWPALVAAFLAALVPLPSRVEAEALEPLHVREDETDAEAAERVRAAMQAGMDRLAARRRTPWG